VVISGHQRSSEVIGGNQSSSERSSEVISGHQRSSEAISERLSVVISGHQWSSEVIRGHLAAHPDPDGCSRWSSVHMPRALIVASHEHLV